MFNVAHRRALGERVQAFIKKSDPDLQDMAGVCDALADAFTDMLGAEVRIRVHCEAGALQKAMEATK